MPALVAGIHVLVVSLVQKTWMAGTSPAMTSSVLLAQRATASVNRQYLFAIGNSSAGNSVMTRQPLSVTTTSSSMRAAE